MHVQDPALFSVLQIAFGPQGDGEHGAIILATGTATTRPIETFTNIILVDVLRCGGEQAMNGLPT